MIIASQSPQLMKIFSMLLFLLSVLSLLSQPSDSTTILVDGFSEWKDPNVYIGDSIIFNHKYRYKLYIFQNQRAFSLCNFTQATLLTKPNSTSYTWHPSRPGFFYFTFNNGSLKSCNHDSQKVSIKVSPSPPPPVQLPPMASTPVPAPIPGDITASPPAWPYHPRDETASSPAPAPSGSAASSPMETVPTSTPDKSGGSGIPFINSNPAVPLPTGEIDSATIRPLSTSGHHQPVAVGLLGFHGPLICAAFLLPLL
uniref:Phytocyanin domain-containing protein n=1 Tax=Populus trichocarpa TaxID=3694 RepID=B9H7S7_POPTR|eukprot:XP_002307499.2 early nodulin-20 [Populus trichocarpa]